MRNRAGILGAMVFSVAALAFAFVAPSAALAVDIIESQAPGGQAETADAGWQAGTCTADPCSAETQGLFFTQAAGHPKAGFTQIIVRHTGPFQEPVGNLKTVLVDLPPGLSVNPQATPQCQLEGGKFPPLGCPLNTQVGTSAVTVSVLNVLPLTIPGLAVYNIAPRSGEPARFGFTLPLGLGEVFLNAGVAWDSDYHEYFTIHVPSVAGTKILKNRLVFDGTTGQSGAGGAFLTNPSTCNNSEVEPFKRSYTTFLHADSVEESAPDDGYDLAAPAPPSTAFLNGSQVVSAPAAERGAAGWLWQRPVQPLHLGLPGHEPDRLARRRDGRSQGSLRALGQRLQLERAGGPRHASAWDGRQPVGGPRAAGL